MHVLRGVLEQIDDHSVHIRVSKSDIKTIKELVNSFKVTSHSNDGLHYAEGQRYDNACVNNSLRFRLDKDEIASGLGTLRQNLINFFTTDTPPFKASTKNHQGKKSSAEERIGEVDDHLLHLRQRMSWLRRA
eukprot:15255984-Ditylum_brightwellii.AAC.1